jgi:LmbE family N-acetylglucosaminyl deacetylase
MEGRRILFLGAHADDFESGAGGLFLKANGKNECFHIAFSACLDQPGNENCLEEFRNSMKTLGIPESRFRLFDIPNTKYPENGARIREILEENREKFGPDTVVTHDMKNVHQDHKCVTEQALRVFKTQSILMYEDLKSTPHFTPNLIVSLTREQLERKIRALECYKSQFRRYYHDMEYVKAIARVRGKRVNAEFGEGFNIYQCAL